MRGRLLDVDSVSLLCEIYIVCLDADSVSCYKYTVMQEDHVKVMYAAKSGVDIPFSLLTIVCLCVCVCVPACVCVCCVSLRQDAYLLHGCVPSDQMFP